MSCMAPPRYCRSFIYIFVTTTAAERKLVQPSQQHCRGGCDPCVRRESTDTYCSALTLSLTHLLTYSLTHSLMHPSLAKKTEASGRARRRGSSRRGWASIAWCRTRCSSGPCSRAHTPPPPSARWSPLGVVCLGYSGY